MRADVDGSPFKVYPVVICIEALPQDGSPRHFQTTFIRVAKNAENEWTALCTKQKIHVDGISYELQEIFGIEQNGEQEEVLEGLDANKECVICLSSARDTAVLPCRHMCMCAKCARDLSFQTNKCPICRCTVEQLLQIKVLRPGEDGDHVALDISTDGKPTKSSIAVASSAEP